jgi:hypothetical protein
LNISKGGKLNVINSSPLSKRLGKNERHGEIPRSRVAKSFSESKKDVSVKEKQKNAPHISSVLKDISAAANERERRRSSIEPKALHNEEKGRPRRLTYSHAKPRKNSLESV